MIGPEDEPKWKHPSNQSKTATVMLCHVCKDKILLYHCAESGCPWCAKCGANAKRDEK